MKRFEKRVLSVREKLRELSFLYCIDYDSNSEVAFDHYERCADDYCRCSTLHPTINSIDYKEIAKYIIDEFKIENEKVKYCIERICSTLNIDDFECNVCGGYYGEEMDSIVIDNYSILNKLEEVIDIKLARKRKLDKIEAEAVLPGKRVKVDSEKIRKVLELEYGYLLNDMSDATFSIIEVDPKDIVFPQKNYLKTLSSEKIKGYKNHQGICGVVRLKGGKFNVVDGYHRISANLYKPKIRVILYT